MKKTLCIILTALLLLSAASCGKTEVPDDTETAKEDVTVTAEAESETEETTKAKQNDTEEVTEDTAEDTDDVTDTDETESTDTEDGEISLAGKWVCGDDRIIFNEDGSCTLCEFGRTQDLEYEIDGDRIIFYEGNNVADDKSYSAKGGKLIITDEGGTRIFTKG